ncbi:acyltransferase family protein [Hymenobacter sediminicola]|uniref:Acyltransferase n=1 Tax=Hymenobacter sediminicola TaxID=2761579 RepID=A0A7G7W327_9BACT|nr:acyltransferase [Hymenobacter sediminicola]QNH60770.1 acyltransferase [Hymenobacter sediminicola]
MAEKTAYYPALTGIRAVAALLVVVFHMSPAAVAGQPLFTTFLQQGHIGVSLFFVLSGFLITARYVESVRLERRWFRPYLQNRFARIYPVYLLLTCFTFAVMVWHPLHTRFEWPEGYTVAGKVRIVLLNLTLLRGYFSYLLNTGLPTAWSLTVEETFYILAPFLIVALRRTWRRLLLYPVAFVLIGALLVGVVDWLTDRYIYGLMGSLKFMLRFTFFGRSAEFIYGMALALWLRKQGGSPRPNSYYTVAGAAGILLFMAGHALLQHIGWLAIDPRDQSYGSILAGNLVLPVAVCALYWGLLYERTLLRTLLESRTFDVLGKSSYVLYLIHLGAVDTLFRRYVTDNNLLCLLFYVGLSILLYTLVEHPLHNRLRATKALVGQ